MITLKKILFPVDLSPVSGKVVPYVVEMATKLDAKVSVLFVARLFNYYSNIYVPNVSIRSFEEEIIRGGEQRLDEFAKDFLTDSIDYRTKVIAGEPGEQIVKRIKTEGIDLVIMGSHGRKGLDRILFGSVAEHVVKMSPAPVLIVNPYRLAKE